MIKPMSTVKAKTLEPIKPSPKPEGFSNSVKDDGSYRSLGQKILASRGMAGEFSAFDSIISQESGWRTSAVNPSSGACGIPQAYPCSKIAGLDATGQINWAIDYMVSRYGSISKAAAFKSARGWY